MTAWGITQSGQRLLLGRPAKASLAHDRDAPADLLRAVFPADRIWEELTELSLYEGERLIFRGPVDEQTAELDGDGLTIELIARSREALLLDNEAPPGVWQAPSLELLENRILSPLGLLLGGGDRSRRAGQLVIEKGQSCWEVLSGFCETCLGTVPRIDSEGLVQCGEEAASEPLTLKNPISAKLSLLPCKRLSEVWQQSCRGGYDTPYRSETKLPMRRRYVSAQSGKNPKELLAGSAAESFRLTVTFPGSRWPGRNGRATVEIPGMGRYENCPVESALYTVDKNGERTRLVLGRPEKEALPCG